MECPVGYECRMLPAALFPPNEVGLAALGVLLGLAALVAAIGWAIYAYNAKGK